MVKLQAQWIVGFVDGEGCFFVGINQQSCMTTGFQVLPEFVVTQHVRDVQILYALKDFWNCGTVQKNHGSRWCYRVRGLEHLQTCIVPFFEKHRLKTKKKVDFLKFRKILHLMQQKQHLTQQGLLTIDRLRLSMNRGMVKPKKRLCLKQQQLFLQDIQEGLR